MQANIREFSLLIVVQPTSEVLSTIPTFNWEVPIGQSPDTVYNKHNTEVVHGVTGDRHKTWEGEEDQCKECPKDGDDICD